jgi:hypothetical protein
MKLVYVGNHTGIVPSRNRKLVIPENLGHGLRNRFVSFRETFKKFVFGYKRKVTTVCRLQKTHLPNFVFCVVLKSRIVPIDKVESSLERSFRNQSPSTTRCYDFQPSLMRQAGLSVNNQWIRRKIDQPTQWKAAVCFTTKAFASMHSRLTRTVPVPIKPLIAKSLGSSHESKARQKVRTSVRWNSSSSLLRSTPRLFASSSAGPLAEQIIIIFTINVQSILNLFRVFTSIVAMNDSLLLPF